MKFLILSLTLFISCSRLPVDVDTDLIGVDLDNMGADTVEIDRSKNVGYGPKQSVGDVTGPTKRIPVISLTLYSSIYHSLAILDLIKQLDKKNIKISMISSQGFGSVVAALYAKEKSTSYLEWKLFALLKKLKGQAVYSKVWNRTLGAFIEKEFNNLKVSQLKILFLTPENNNNNKLFLSLTDKVSSVLKRTLNIKSDSNFLSKPKLYSSNLKKLGADLSYSLSFLPARINFNNITGFEWGIYTKYLGFVMSNPEDIRVFRSEKSAPLDQLNSLSDINKLYSSFFEEYTSAIIKDIEQWQEEFTSSSNN